MGNRYFSWHQAVVDADICDLPPNAKLIVLLIATYMNELGESTPLTIATIAEKAGLSSNTIDAYIRVAIDAGFLKAIPRDLDEFDEPGQRYLATFPSRSVVHGGQNG